MSWESPLGRALTGATEGDEVTLRAPGGAELLSVLEVLYKRIPVEAFLEPASPHGLEAEIP